ncbi:MAG: hypothetical protein ABSC31_13700 [Acidimicrobiales bacterium]|jgi:hypothetical protein
MESYPDVRPDGGPFDAQTITCNCKVCKGKSAKVRGAQKYTPTMVHNLVGVAHSPLARAASTQQWGPWPL